MTENNADDNRVYSMVSQEYINEYNRRVTDQKFWEIVKTPQEGAGLN